MVTGWRSGSALVERFPTFILIGAAKAGTTAIMRYLGRHPDVFLTRPAEPSYFARQGGERETARYLALFDQAGLAIARGEGSNAYSQQATFPGVPERMHRVIPEVRLVYVLREPMARLRSHYLMKLREGTTEGSFQDFVTRTDFNVDISCYARQLRAYLAWFDPEQIHVTRLEDLATDPTRVLRDIAAHIGVEPSFFGDDGSYGTVNAAPSGPARRYPKVPRLLRSVTSEMPSGVRRSIKSRLPLVEASGHDLVLDATTEAALRERFAADQRDLKELLGDDFDDYD